MARKSPWRRQGWIPTSELPVPDGAPGRVRLALRRARVARELGRGLGSHLLEVKGGRRLVLVFRGTGWEGPLRSCSKEIRERLEHALGHPVEHLEVRGVDLPEQPGPGTSDRRAGRSPGGSAGAEELRDRLRRLGRRLVERREAEAGEPGEFR